MAPCRASGGRYPLTCCIPLPQRVGSWPAIFSDHYGVWFSDERHEWYGDDVGDPNSVVESTFWELVKNFDERLRDYSEIHFYHNPGLFHPLYRRLLKESGLRDRIVKITHLWDIV